VKTSFNSEAFKDRQVFARQETVALWDMELESLHT